MIFNRVIFDEVCGAAALECGGLTPLLVFRMRR